MFPVLFEVPGLGWDVPGYGLALMIGFLVSIWWAAQRALKSGADPDVVLNCGFIALLGGVVGSRVMYVVHYWEEFANRPNLWWALLDVRRGGLEVYGGVIVVAVVVFVYLRMSRLSLRWYLDIMAPSAALGMGLGRIGCFLNGCCFGGPCDLPWAVQFPYGSPAAVKQWVDRRPGAGLPDELVLVYPDGMLPDGSAAHPVSRELLSVSVSDADILAAQAELDELEPRLAELRRQIPQAASAAERQRLEAEQRALEQVLPKKRAEYFDIRAQMALYNLTPQELRALAREYPSLPVHPTQLYSVVVLVVLALLLNALYWRRTRDGQVFFTFLVLEPPTRWLLEVLRDDNPVDTLGTLTISQFIAIAVVLVGVAGLVWLRSQPPRSPRARRWEPPAVEGSDRKKPATAPR